MPLATELDAHAQRCAVCINIAKHMAMPVGSPAMPAPAVVGLSVADSAVCVVYLAATVLVGLLAGRRDKRTATAAHVATSTAMTAAAGHNGSGGRYLAAADGYLLADRQVGAWAIALSSAAALTSGLTLLGGPGLVFTVGAAPSALNTLAVLGALAATATVVTDTFVGLRLTTAYQYLGLRFASPVRDSAATTNVASRHDLLHVVD